MTEPKYTARAVVTFEVRVILSQPWGDKFSIGDIFEQATREAKAAIHSALSSSPERLRFSAPDVLKVSAVVEKSNG